jgi:hypothetical protein
MLTKPTDETVAALVDLLPPELSEMYHERSSVREFDGGMTRLESEAVALLDVLERHPDALTGVTVLAVELDGSVHFYIADSIDRAREHSEAKKANEIRAAGLLWTLQEEFGGLAEMVVAE